MLSADSSLLFSGQHDSSLRHRILLYTHDGLKRGVSYPVVERGFQATIANQLLNRFKGVFVPLTAESNPLNARGLWLKSKPFWMELTAEQAAGQWVHHAKIVQQSN